jgi:hypothetical protein
LFMLVNVELPKVRFGTRSNLMINNLVTNEFREFEFRHTRIIANQRGASHAKQKAPGGVIR